MKKIGILSDTHSCWDDRYAKHFAGCDEIWHAGDIGDISVIRRLEEISPVVRAVSGNIDHGEVNMSAPLSLGVPNPVVIANADPYALIAQIDAAEKLRETHYTEASWQVLKSALEAAKLVRDEADPTQERIDQATATLASAIAALERYTAETPPVEEPQKKGPSSLGEA